jgi:hypothetical protein
MHLPISAQLLVAGLTGLALSACGESGVEKAVTTGLREADAVGKSATEVRVTDPDTDLSEVLEYVHEGGHWVYHGCEALERTGTQPNCTEPSGAPDEYTP